MMKPAPTILYVIFLVGFLLSGCSTLREALLGRTPPLAPLDNARLGRTSREEVVSRFGAPDEINERRLDTYSTEIFYYYDQEESETGYLQLKVLSCEFSKGSLMGYLFQKIGASHDVAFADNNRGKLVRGKTTRREAEEILGTPNGRSLVPTTLNLNSLGGQIGGIAVPVSKPPENAKEIWFYCDHSVGDEQHRPHQRSLAVFFDEAGIYLGSMELQQIIGKLP